MFTISNIFISLLFATLSLGAVSVFFPTESNKKTKLQEKAIMFFNIFAIVVFILSFSLSMFVGKDAFNYFFPELKIIFGL
ncbi:MAG: hypothetical protein WCO84_03690 [bacterium]